MSGQCPEVFKLCFLLGGILTFYSGWRTIFFLTIPIEILVLWLIFTRIKGECELVRMQNPDIPGMILYGTSIFFVMAGFSMLPQSNGLFIAGAGAVCLIILLVFESRVNPPADGCPVIEQKQAVRNH